MSTWKKVVIAIGTIALVLAIAGALSGPAANVAPPSRAELTSYTENRDADAADEVVAYFQLFDNEGNPTSCDCTVSYEYGDADEGVWSTIHQERATRQAFVETTIGIGAFEREAFLFATILDGHEIRCDDGRERFSYDIRVTILTDDLIRLQATDIVIC